MSLVLEQSRFYTTFSSIPHDIWFIITSYTCPLTLRALNKSYYKRNHKKARHTYPNHFLNFDYLDSMLMKVTYDTLCDYFSNSYQCKGFTKKNIRCQKRCKDKYCHLHAKKNTLITYYQSHMYTYLTTNV
jgi:hypothetical protein